MSYNKELIEFCNYVQPIVNGCSGFIKTSGYMTHFPGVIVFMDDDETCCGIIHIPIIYNVYMTSVINTFLSLKTPEEQSEMYSAIYFVGYNIKQNHLLNYYNLYERLDDRQIKIFNEPDCYNISGFENSISKTDIGYVNVSDGHVNYRIPASKSITSLSKSDSCSLSIYDCIYNNPMLKTIRYTMMKKKFKIFVNIYSNIIVL